MDTTTDLKDEAEAIPEPPRSTNTSRRSADSANEPLRPHPDLAASQAATELVEGLSAYHGNPRDERLIRHAYAIASEAHQDQRRNSGEPYIDHPVAVARILIDLHLDAASVAAALLHDVIEDTRITKVQVDALFGAEIANLVDGVTKLSKLEHQSKEEAQAGSYRKMFVAMADDPRVVLVKLADRLHNLRTIKFKPIESQHRTARETMEIYAPLANRLGIWKMKWELEDLSFAVLNPEKYQEITREISQHREARERVIQRVIVRLNQILEREGLKADITGRPKHIYSIYRKMERKNVSLDEIYDQLAVRVIVDCSEVGECYRVLGLVHATWPPVPGEFDDYIAMPKESMYQSLHTTVLIPGGQPCEVQIRTAEMHQVAEHGIAAHWRYKEGFGRTDSSFDAKLTWLRRLIEWRRELPAEEFVDEVKKEELEEQVYVFTPKGRIIDLPLGSTPIDFAYRIHSEIGHSCVGSKVNNRLVPLDYKLQNGEIVNIMTSKTPRGPSHDWLNFAKTSGARNHIRRYFKKLHRDDNITDGRDLLEKELKLLSLVIPFDEIASEVGVKTIEELFAQIGSGDVTARTVAQRLMAHRTPIAELAPEIPQINQTNGHKPDPQGIRVRGVDGVMARMAKCCNPVTGEPIAGFITRGRGITIHRADCRMVVNERDRERLVDVSWGAAAPPQGSPVPVRIEAWDRVGLWRDISSAVADANINIDVVEQVPTRKIGRAVLRITLRIGSVSQLATIIDKLNRLSDVIDARRDNSGLAVSTSGS
ncbi:MAG: bifunctional (p)ppGpp synthetase/guanosine-3',5'-bis(diphosphate) 3'-pyrophosphohydrolase [Roseiflexaceae bacterium]|nr:bifunctional (p)ppGpp synthetase/guanosine-3',5'-bis(diphosphate) 3'-pyrophosphohydrolase [Roseiflexaceae bacterium]